MHGITNLLTPEFSIFWIFAAVCGILWTYCYYLVIRIGLKDKTCGMPIEALAFNFAWEIVFGIVWFALEPGQNLQAYINIVWGLFDIGILITFFLYAATRGTSAQRFKLYGVGCLVFAFAIIGAAFYHEYPEVDALHALTAWLVNGVMSLMFIKMLWSRGPKGQSMKIAWSKALGTFAVTLGFSHPTAAQLFEANYPVIIATGWLCFAFDLTYCYLLSRALRAEKEKA